MGIRYYAYAYEAADLDEVLADPSLVISDDPLADAWGFTPHTYGLLDANFQQSVPEDQMLYLDKAWSHLQWAIRPEDGQQSRPAYRMFEGKVANTSMGHLPFERVLTPDQVLAVAADLVEVSDENVAERLRRCPFYRGDDLPFVLDHLQRARTFVTILASRGQGMAYTIG